jgi:hypothetical protein
MTARVGASRPSATAKHRFTSEAIHRAVRHRTGSVASDFRCQCNEPVFAPRQPSWPYAKGRASLSHAAELPDRRWEAGRQSAHWRTRPRQRCALRSQPPRCPADLFPKRVCHFSSESLSRGVPCGICCFRPGRYLVNRILRRAMHPMLARLGGQFL